MDKTIVCEDCKDEFVWTEGEQEFYAARDYVAPKRCKSCRNKRKADRDQ